MENEDEFIKREVDKAIRRVNADIESDRDINMIINFFKERRFDLHHPDVPENVRNYIYDLMNRWPKVSFVEHCLITHFFTIREDPNVTYDINPQKMNDVSEGDSNLLNNIE